MAALKFPAFLRKHQLQLLAVATEDIGPGTVLDEKKRGFLPQGHLREVLEGRPARFWSVVLRRANLAEGTIERTVGLTGKSRLNEMGVEVGGGLERATSVTFAITKVTARAFAQGSGRASKLALLPLLVGLREEERAAWKTIKGKWIVLETYHASEATLSFSTRADVDLEAEVDAAGGARVHGGGRLRWTGKRSFRIARNDSVPFAFRGFRVGTR
jgi:hypothetical protein